MDLRKLVQKTVVLNNAKTVLEVEKSLSLLTIFKLSKLLNANLARSNLNKSNIEYVSRLIDYNNVFFVKKNRNIKPNIWIYLTEDEKYEVDGYSRFEKVILQNLKTDDLLITIGKRAKEFTEKNNLVTYKSFDNAQSDNIINNVVSLIIKNYSTGKFDFVKFVLNTTKLHNKYIDILPIQNMDESFLGYNENKTNDLTNKFVYPNAEIFVQNEIHNYLIYVVQSLFIESSFYTAKNKLVSENQLLNKIDDDIFIIKRKIARIKSEKQIEEIVMLSKNKSFVQLEKGNDEK
ncbi:MSC_0622 family F1-like ATPase gamma subunit [Mycoplasma crocodyli]|uniref:ATP synthase gamma chain n=1 Tax=Mycoplasma crocodyli (strain ATCC 51981 / MP145) TaxID=512564 RepID=D5E4T7_MYCCM|nr:hypothetical protein [Mycoplasma crocodyli]ADE19560.1 conserved hypothetical protein [Mycoplasma crocodyli MP145]